MSEEMLMDAIGAIGQHLSDKLDYASNWNPEANKYSRSINPDVLTDLIANHLTNADLFVLMSLIRVMSSENKIGAKYLKTLNIPRTSLYEITKRLKTKGTIWELRDGTIMINPSIAVLSKYRKNCLLLKNIWISTIKESVKLTQEIEQSEKLF